MPAVHTDLDYSWSRRQLLKLGAKGVLLGAAGISLPSLNYLREAAGVELDPGVQLFDGMLRIFLPGGSSIGQDVADYKDPADNPTTPFRPVNLGANDVYNQPIRVTTALAQTAAKVQGDAAVNLAILRSLRHGTLTHPQAMRMKTAFWQGGQLNQMPALAPTLAHYFQGRGLGIPAVLIRGDNGVGANATRGNVQIPTALEVTVGAGQGSNPVVQALDLPPGVDLARYARRRAMVEKLNARYLAKTPDAVAQAWGRASRDAYDVTFKGEAAQAFDLRGKPLLPGGNTAIRQRATLAQNLLLAGVPYVTLGIGQNDGHLNNPQLVRRNWQENIDVFLPPLIDALKLSGKRYLIMVDSEFDRTPDGKGSFLRGAGREHWPHAHTNLLISINQPKLKTTAVGDTGPRGLATVTSTRRRGIPGTLKDPFPLAALAYVLYRSLGINLFQPDGYFDIPTQLRDAPPVDRQLGLTAGVRLSNFLIT